MHEIKYTTSTFTFTPFIGHVSAEELLYNLLIDLVPISKVIFNQMLEGGGGGANAPKGPTHIKNPKRALENGAFWGLLGPFDPVFLA